MNRAAEVVIAGRRKSALGISLDLWRAGVCVSVVEHGQIGPGASSPSTAMLDASQKKPALGAERH